jgi:hypothetical protein
MALDISHDARPDAFELAEGGRHHVVSVVGISKNWRAAGTEHGSEEWLTWSISRAWLHVPQA